ncbi:Uncharacterized membrane-anchored protein [hydrothermal vent metagenome]|uniref:Uncharacterized membrane-anchored protein n=1 Tax=hydrothermal vent metagenome TaxID=652676 RepID=A0A3B1B007_9ZZZZ
MITFSVPSNHPQRFALNNEVHARPCSSLYAPERASHLALIMTADEKVEERKAIAGLCERYIHPLPAPDADHFAADFGSFRLRWEQHSEFSTYAFHVHGPFSEPFSEPALHAVPADWLKSLPGQLVVGAHSAIMKTDEKGADLDAISPLFADNTLVGSEVSGGAAQLFTDFRIHADGFSRFLIYDRRLRSRQLGRLSQRLFEVEVYRMMALLTFPIARALIPQLNEADQRLLTITTAMSQSGSDEADLLDSLTLLASEIEHNQSSTQFRLSASQAYFNLVGKRIDGMREERIRGIQTLREFIDRRLEPAMSTCASVARRQTMLSQRIARASQLLRTRVEVALERQNQTLLESMNQRAKLQLRLQETVEGLSVAAITYYAVSLISYLAKAGKSVGWAIEPELVVGISIPVVAVMVIIGVRRIRKIIEKAQKSHG